MFSLTGGHQYYLCTGATDMRKGFNSLCGLVRSQMGRDPLSGEVFLFINKKRQTIKLLHWERGGLVIYHKRLEKGCFERPLYDDRQQAYRMSWPQLVMMVEGVSLQQRGQRKRYR